MDVCFDVVGEMNVLQEKKLKVVVDIKGKVRVVINGEKLYCKDLQEKEKVFYDYVFSGEKIYLVVEEMYLEVCNVMDYVT